MTTTRRRPTPFEPLIRKIERAEALDGPAKPIAKRVRELVSPRAVKEAVSGTWLGHALHPVLTDVVIGSFISATLLDALGGDADGRASERLIGVGMAAFAPTALTGANDWADTEPASDAVRRDGLVHATTNSTALALYVASLRARRRGDEGRGKLVGGARATGRGAAGYLRRR